MGNREWVSKPAYLPLPIPNSLLFDLKRFS